jgi:hypothetical protein
MTVSRNSIVLDTNLIVSAFLIPRSVASQALDIALEFFDLACSKQIFTELLDVLKRDKFDRYLSKEERMKLLEVYTQSVIFFDDTLDISDCKDPKDNKFLSLALTCNAKLIVSGDKRDLLVMNPYKGIEIICLRDFLDNFQKYLSISKH